MPSPFPGMDPWLEGRVIFPDFHNSFIAYMRESLNAVLPPPYFAAIGTRVLIEGDTDRLVEPDIDILRPYGSDDRFGTDGGGGAATAVETLPIVVHVPLAETTEWFVEVRTGEDDERLVMSIEVLSRSNKRAGSPGRTEYLQKQKEMVERGVSLVEIDFLRSGTHTTAVARPPALKKAGPFDCHACVSRGGRREDFEVYPMRLGQALPPLKIPLGEGSADVPIPLQPVLDRCYDAGLYARRIRYAEPTDPPLTPEQQAWAERALKAKGGR